MATNEELTFSLEWEQIQGATQQNIWGMRFTRWWVFELWSTIRYRFVSLVVTNVLEESTDSNFYYYEDGGTKFLRRVGNNPEHHNQKHSVFDKINLPGLLLLVLRP
jgi:hypothetical protein